MKAAIFGLLICFCAAYLTVTEANYGCPIPTLCKLHCLRKLCIYGRCGGRGWVKRQCKCYFCKRSSQDKAIGDSNEELPADELNEEIPADESNEEFPADESNEELPADESNEEFPADEFTEEFPIDDIN